MAQSPDPMLDGRPFQHENCVVVLVRAPDIGHVKTRLMQYLPAETVLALYQCLVEDTLAGLEKSGLPIVLAYTPQHAKKRIAQWLGHRYQMLPQSDGDLGLRMASAFEEIFSCGVGRALLIGTDFPDLPASCIPEAFDRLTGRDAVIGPAVDGGYYLIGFNRHSYVPEIFQAMPWGTDRVFQKTMGVFEDAHSRVQVLAPWRDIDRYEDLISFSDRNRYRPETAPKTVAFIAEHPWVLHQAPAPGKRSPGKLN
jgi:rSAM/selenodomain-associated transferase 1